MKILVFGFLVLFGWSALSTYIYVCKIKGLCSEQETIENNTVNKGAVTPGDSLPGVLVPEKVVIPKNLLIYFAFDKSEFSSDSKTDKYTDESNAYLNQNSQAKLIITGHTDAIGSEEYNQALGYRRAQSVQRYFETRGIPEKKIIIESRGEKEPADNNNTTSGRANNRRTAITIKN